jgi:FSR family fosmidomycin resistance protein-like MFS transporter
VLSISTRVSSLPMSDNSPKPKSPINQVMIVSGGHFFHDLYTSFLAPLLPTLIENLSLSLTSAGILTTFSRLPSIFNPFIGYLADKIGARYFVILAPAITSTLMSLIGKANSFYSLAVILFAAGLSSTMFHATSPALIASASSGRKGRGFSLFMAGGGIGRSLGPIAAVWAVSIWGMGGLYRLMILGWSASILLFFQFRNIDTTPKEKPSLKPALPTFRRFFLPLTLVLLLRSTLTAALSTYLPVYMVQSGAPLWIAGASLSVLELAGVAGALFIGPYSDRFGRRKSLSIAMFFSAIFVPVFLQASGWFVFPILVLLGIFSFSPGTLFLALVQDHFEEHRSTGNGIYLLIHLLSNGLMLILIGVIGDHYGLKTAYLIGAATSLLSIPALTLLPLSPKNKHLP